MPGTEYIGKHEKRMYKVWRVLSAAGPEETIYISGLKEAREAILGCWDWTITEAETEKEITQ